MQPKKIVITMKKIKQILCAAAVTTVFCACGSKNNFTINGTLDNPEMEGKTVYVINMSNEAQGESCAESNGPVDSADLYNKS